MFDIFRIRRYEITMEVINMSTKKPISTSGENDSGTVIVDGLLLKPNDGSVMLTEDIRAMTTKLTRVFTFLGTRPDLRRPIVFRSY